MSLKIQKNQVLIVNTKLNVQELEDYMKQWKDRPSKIAASFTHISELEDKHLKHFKGAPYMWRPVANSSLWGGVLIDDKLDYLHIVLAVDDVMEYLISLK